MSNFPHLYQSIFWGCYVSLYDNRQTLQCLIHFVMKFVTLCNTWPTLKKQPVTLCNTWWVRLKDHRQQTHVNLQSRGQVITWQMKNCYISISTRPIATKLDREVGSDGRMLFAKPHNLFITWIYQVTWNVISPIPRDLWPKNLTR